MKRILVLLTAALVMAAMMVAMAMPAFAKSTYTCQSQFGTHSGVPKESVKNSTFYFNCEKERKNV